MEDLALLQKYPFFAYIKCLSKVDPEIYGDLMNNTKKSLFLLEYFERITIKYLCEKEDKIKLRNINYIKKISKDVKTNKKYKIYHNDNDNQKKKINQAFIIMFFYLSKYIMDIHYYKKMINLYDNVTIIIGKCYQDTVINDEYFEVILKLLLFLAMSSSTQKEPNEKDEIINIIYFKKCIDLIKLVFTNLIKLNNKISQKQEEIINNIIIFINKNILNACDKSNKLSYINKVFLTNNDYKSLLLIDLYFIVSKVNSKEIKKNFIDLLTNIYYFSFGHENLMSPMLRQIEPLFININKKNIKQINDELDISDFSLSLLNSLILKEKQILKENSCLLKSGFYFGDELSGIICEFNSFKNECIILFGFKLESYEMDEITLLQIDHETEEFRFGLKKNNKDNKCEYEMYLYDSYDKENKSINITLEANINYILTIQIKNEGIMFNSKVINVKYVKDCDNKAHRKNKSILTGKELKIKGSMKKNYNMYFGCEIKSNNIINKFRGFFGDIIILDIKNKSINNIKFSELLLHLEGNYNEIVSIFCENDNNIFMIYNSNFPNFIELKNKIKTFEEKDNPLYNSIKSIISTNYFKFVEYKNLNNHNNFNNLSFEKKITDFRIQSDSSENEKKIKILTSSFNKNFHIFQNNLAALEFIKYGGINYLSLLLEYYYQILSHILQNINSYQKKEIKEICQKINQKILNNISFFNINVININFNFRMINPINKYLTVLDVTKI